MVRRDFMEEHGILFDETRVSNDVMFSARVGFHMKNFAVDENVLYIITRGAGKPYNGGQ